ncbi:MAG: tyrosine protein phosphatase [Pseudomonadota bacterium]
MSYLVVCPLLDLARVVTAHSASHVLTVISDDMPVPTPSSVSLENHLTLHFNDIAVASPGLSLAKTTDIDKMIGFAKSWDQVRPMVIHCWMGVSRSTASAATVLATLQPDRPAQEIFAEIRFNAPFASPNHRIVTLADATLHRGGEMIAALENLATAQECFQGMPFKLDLD